MIQGHEENPVGKPQCEKMQKQVASVQWKQATRGLTAAEILTLATGVYLGKLNT